MNQIKSIGPVSVFLAVFLAGFCLAQELAQLQIVGKPEKSSTEFVGASIRDINGRICAAVQVISDLDGFTYDAYNDVVKVTAMPGRDMVYLQPDERVLTIFHSGYEPLKIILFEVGIRLEQKAVWVVKISGEKKTGDLLPVTFFIEPSDAKLIVTGKPARSGQPVQLAKGEHRIMVSKEGYRTIDKVINVSENRVVFNETLEEVELQQVIIQSSPSGAKIILDGVEKGLTDRGLFLYPGLYQLRLLLTGYTDIEETLSVREGSSNQFSYTLTKNSGTFIWSVTPTDAQVLVNREEMAGRSSVELAPGLYRVEISRTGYHPVSETVTIERGRTLRRAYQLEAITGSLQFTVQPLEARVELKVGSRVIKSWQGMQMLKDLPVGSYTLESGATGYETARRTVTISEGKTEVIDLRLEKQAVAPARQPSETGAGTMRGNDGKTYKTVKIGNQIWMAENLRETRYRDGSIIPVVIGDSQWTKLSTGARCVYDNNESNAGTYGYLYNWYVVNDRRNIAPPGWRVPTDADWKELERALGMSRSDADNTGWRGTPIGSKLAGNASLWASGDLKNHSEFGTSGFSALPGGDRGGRFYPLGGYAHFWSATEYDTHDAWFRRLVCSSSDVLRGYLDKPYGFSVRLVRD